jgi:hypothetical protein
MSANNCLRNVVCYCSACDTRRDVICREDDVVNCYVCSSPMEQHWWERQPRQATVWNPNEWATVFKKPDGTFSFPMKADKPTPPGCERITIRSDAEMARIERAARVRSERRWFDSGSGGGHDTEDLPPLPFAPAVVR